MDTTLFNKLCGILGEYDFSGNVKEIKPITVGHINDTFVVEYITEEGKIDKYLLQWINHNVFKNPVAVMENVVGITEHIKKKVALAGGDTEREVLTVFKTKTGENFVKTEDGGHWRVYNFVDNAYSLDGVNSKDDFKMAAVAFGNFQKQLADYPIETLKDTIPNFHNTVSRFKDFKVALEENRSGRKNEAEKEIAFVLERENDCSVLTDLIAKGELPLRVTHNDTKLNNVLFDKETNQPLCIVDLDTVMPGSSLYDFGDSIRFGANTGSEDEKDLSKISLDLELFKAYVEGYLSSAGDSLCENEVTYLPFAAKLLTFECGIRFLADFINGYVYFKTEYPEHNLVRARTQFKLVSDIEKKFSDMETIVNQAKMSKI